MAQISICGVVWCDGYRKYFLPGTPTPALICMGAAQIAMGDLLKTHNWTLEKESTRGHFLVPEGISARGSSHVLLALVLLEISSHIRPEYNPVVNKPGLLPGRAVVQMRPPGKHLANGICWLRASHSRQDCLVPPGPSSCAYLGLGCQEEAASPAASPSPPLPGQDRRAA